jgi:DNA repair photolyase
LTKTNIRSNLAMPTASYHETTCKTALNRVRGMPFAWSLNPYRGCTHGCHYCYARSTHTYYGLSVGKDFSSKIIVKTNFVESLRRELQSRSWQREPVAIGTATDAYQPCEGRYRITRRVLEALRDCRTPASVVTKSTLVLRDADLLAELARVAGATVYFTVTTLDPDVWRAVEPGTPPPAKRLCVMRRLVDAGVPCGVFLAPILPGITDSADSIDAVAAAAKAHGAISFGTSVLRLAPVGPRALPRLRRRALPRPPAAVRTGVPRNKHPPRLPRGDGAAGRPDQGMPRLRQRRDGRSAPRV